MKKLLVLLLTVLLIGCMATCAETTPTTSHTHSYTETVTAPTCTEKGFTTFTCACGDTYTAQETEMNDHTWQEATAEAPKTCGTCGLTEGKALPDARFDPEECASLFGTWVVEHSDTIKETKVFRDDGLVFYLMEYNGQVGSAGYECYYVADDQLWIGYHWNEMRAQDYTLDGEKLTLNTDELELTKTSDSMKRPADPEGKFDPEVCAPLFGTWETEMNGDLVHYIFTDSGEMYGVVSNGLDSMAAYMTYYVVDGRLHTGMNWESQGSGPFSVEGNKLILYNEEAGEIMSEELSRVSDDMETPLMYVHSCDYIAEVTLPTCLKKGYTTYTCKLCGKTKKDDYTDRLPHEWEEEIVPPTCYSSGYTNRTCTNCETVTTVDWVESVACEYVGEIIVPTHTSGGYTVYTCRYCDGQYFDDYTDEITDCRYNAEGLCDICGESCLKFSPWLSENGQICEYSVFVDINARAMITSVVIPCEYNGQPVTAISEYAFERCFNLTSIIIPDSVTSIGNYAFSGCIGLTSIEIPSGVINIGDLAFYCCTSLTSIEIPNSVTSIGYSAFMGCNSLTYNRNDNAYYLGNPDNLYVVLIKAISPNITGCIISDNTKFIYDMAFAFCGSLTSITIPDSVTSIGSYAFSGCSGLTSIEIPSGVINIDSSTFWLCSSLTSIHFEGTMEQWNDVEKAYGWDENTGNYTVYCTDGEIKK